MRTLYLLLIIGAIIIVLLMTYYLWPTQSHNMIGGVSITAKVAFYYDPNKLTDEQLLTFGQICVHVQEKLSDEIKNGKITIIPNQRGTCGPPNYQCNDNIMSTGMLARVTIYPMEKNWTNKIDSNTSSDDIVKWIKTKMDLDN
jgi:hypothetical protein